MIDSARIGAENRCLKFAKAVGRRGAGPEGVKQSWYATGTRVSSERFGLLFTGARS